MNFINCYDAEIKKMISLIYTYYNPCKKTDYNKLYLNIFQHYLEIYNSIKDADNKGIINGYTGIIYYIFENYQDSGLNIFEDLEGNVSPIEFNYFKNFETTEIFKKNVILRGKYYSEKNQVILISEYIDFSDIHSKNNIIFEKEKFIIKSKYSFVTDLEIFYENLNIFIPVPSGQSPDETLLITIEGKKYLKSTIFEYFNIESSRLVEITPFFNQTANYLRFKFISSDSLDSDSKEKIFFISNKYIIEQKFNLFENFCSYRDFKFHIKFQAEKKKKKDYELLLNELNGMLEYNSLNRLILNSTLKQNENINSLINYFNF